MTEENTQLAIAGADDLAALLAGQQKATEEELATVSSDNSFFPRLQLFTGKSKACTGKKILAEHFGLTIGQNIIDLGETVDVLPLVYRPKALDTGETILQSYTPSSEQFQDIMARAAVKDSGCMFGPEYLCWVPSQRAFATLFFSSATMRNEAPAMKSRLGQPCTLQPQHINPPKSKYDWWTTQVLPCSTPFDLPSRKELLDATERYNASEDTQIEKTEEVAEGADRR